MQKHYLLLQTRHLILVIYTNVMSHTLMAEVCNETLCGTSMLRVLQAAIRCIFENQVRMQSFET